MYRNVIAAILLATAIGVLGIAQGCATGQSYRVTDTFGECSLDALAQVDVGETKAGAEGYCAAQIPGQGPGVLAGFLGTVFVDLIEPGETPEAAFKRIRTKATAIDYGGENPAN